LTLGEKIGYLELKLRYIHSSVQSSARTLKTFLFFPEIVENVRTKIEIINKIMQQNYATKSFNLLQQLKHSTKPNKFKEA